MVVESRSVIRNAKNARGLGRDIAPFPKSCPSYFRFARFNTFPLYYLRAWHRSCASYFRFARFNTFPLYYLRAWHRSCASYFRFARFNTFPLYYLRAWHRLEHRQPKLTLRGKVTSSRCRVTGDRYK